MKIKIAVKSMLKIVDELRKTYPKRKFTLDGRLVGDLGEILVEQSYDVNLYKNIKAKYDGETPDGKKVQIKTTMQDSLTFPADFIPDFYIGIKIKLDGTFYEIYNGPGELIFQLIKDRVRPTNNLHNIPINRLIGLNNQVEQSKKIGKRY